MIPPSCYQFFVIWNTLGNTLTWRKWPLLLTLSHSWLLKAEPRWCPHNKIPAFLKSPWNSPSSSSWEAKQFSSFVFLCSSPETRIITELPCMERLKVPSSSVKTQVVLQCPVRVSPPPWTHPRKMELDLLRGSFKFLLARRSFKALRMSCMHPVVSFSVFFQL